MPRFVPSKMCRGPVGRGGANPRGMEPLSAGVTVNPAPGWRPEVPKQGCLILPHSDGAERGGFEQRLRGAQRQQVRERAFVQRVEEGCGSRIEDRPIGLDAEACAALHGVWPSLKWERGGNVCGAVEHPLRPQRSGVCDDLVAPVGQTSDPTRSRAQPLDRGRCQEPFGVCENVGGSHQP
jgi:hypothetical protein